MIKSTQIAREDTTLIRAAQRGIPGAFEELVRPYDHAVLRLAFQLTGSERDAHRIYQESFLEIHRNLGQLRRDGSLHTWIYRVAVGRILDHLRKKGTVARGEASRGFEKLSPRELVIFHLEHYHGLKLRALSEVLDTTEGAVKGALLRAVCKLRASMEFESHA